jgi:hypothetical protein
MGGIGSGMWPRASAHPVTDELPQIDIGDWERAGLLENGSSFDKYIPGAHLSVEVQGNHVTMQIQARGRGAQWVDVDLEEMYCNFGGVRRWFICPQSQCRRRAGILYIAEDLACRKCLRLVYQSQREDESLRARRRALKARNRLGDCDGPAISVLPPKPPFMRWVTYWRIAKSTMMDTLTWLDGSRQKVFVATVLANRAERDIAVLRLRQELTMARVTKRMRSAHRGRVPQHRRKPLNASGGPTDRDAAAPIS